MKTFRKITSILFVAATMLMAACDPNDDQFPTIIAFKSTASGKFTSRYVSADRNDEETVPFTYTYKRPNGTITLSADGMTETLNFTYNAEKETLTLYGSEGYSLNFTPLRTAK